MEKTVDASKTHGLVTHGRLVLGGPDIPNAERIVYTRMHPVDHRRNHAVRDAGGRHASWRTRCHNWHFHRWRIAGRILCQVPGHYGLDDDVVVVVPWSRGDFVFVDECVAFWAIGWNGVAARKTLGTFELVLGIAASRISLDYALGRNLGHLGTIAGQPSNMDGSHSVHFS